jgi:hypothetical protein
MTPTGVFETGASGSVPSNEVFCCNIRRSRAFVRSAGSGWHFRIDLNSERGNYAQE